MSAIVSDTHSAVWFLLNSPELSSKGQQAMRKAVVAKQAIYISVISLVELTYLVEKNRIPETELQILLNALKSRKSNFKLVPVNLAVAQALRRVLRSEVPDMPDRIIAATALHLNLPLVTRDGKIRATNLTTIW